MDESKTDTVGKALGLLGRFGSFPHGATAGQVAAESGMPFSTTYRQLNSLVRAGFLEYREQDKTYALGLRIFQLAQQVSSVRGFSGTALPVL